MKTSTIRRALALFLCTQPVLWKSNVVLAQSLQPGASSPGMSIAPPSGPGDVELGRLERSAGVSPPPALDAPVDPDAYVCGPGDVIELNFWGLQNFKLRTTVDLEGRAFVPRVGYFELGGKTLTEARRQMREAVAKYYPRLSFDVVVAEPRTFVVQVVDAVGKPGSYPARAVDRLATIVARAGGVAATGSTRRIEIRRRGGEVLRPDLLLFALTGDVKHNPFLLDGDVVRVPFVEVAASIGGAVNRPGRYELVGTKDLVELLSLAGGFSPGVTTLLPLTLVRRLPDDRQDLKAVEFKADAAPALAVQHDDTIHVPSYGELQRSVMVVGAVAGSGVKQAGSGELVPDESSGTRRLPFVDGDSVRTLLERVGGVLPLADLEHSYLLRAGKSVPVNLHALVMLRDLSADRPVELGDTLVVPFKKRSVLVAGAVFKPGEYVYNPTYGVDEYLSLAGGRNRFALSVEDVRVVAPGGQTAQYKRDLHVDPGSTVVVPERNFSRSEVVQIMLGVASVIVSGVAVVLAARK